MTPTDIEPDMTNSSTDPNSTNQGAGPDTSSAAVDPVVEVLISTQEKDERRRRLLLILLLLILLANCCVAYLFLRYRQKPQPLPQMLLPTQVSSVCYPPTYKFAIPELDGPVSITVSPDGQRIYAAESQGERLIKMFDRDGKFILSFVPPGTDKSNRDPKYIAADSNGRVFVVDRTSNAIDIYDQDGNFIDAIIGQQLTLSKYLTQQIGEIPAGTVFTHYEGINKLLSFQVPDEITQTLKINIPDSNYPWSPLGVRFDDQGNLLYTDLTSGLHSVRIIPAADLNGPLANYNPQIEWFGIQGSGNGEFEFPQVAVQNGDGNYYVSDGNNARVQVWSSDLQYKTFFGFGSAQGATNLPRGLWLGNRNCLHLADAVASYIRVYDISGEEPVFAFEIGGFGMSDGQFGYPTDVYIDGTGRLYITDRENGRIQVWSY